MQINIKHDTINEKGLRSLAPYRSQLSICPIVHQFVRVKVGWTWIDRPNRRSESKVSTLMRVRTLSKYEHIVKSLRRHIIGIIVETNECI